MNNTEHGPLMVFMCVWVFSLIQLWSKLLRWVFVFCNEEVFPFQMISKSPYSKINYVWLTLPESHGYPYMHFTSIKTALTRALVHVLLLSNCPPPSIPPFFIALEEHYIIAFLKNGQEYKEKQNERDGGWGGDLTDRPYLWHFSSLVHIFRTEALDSITAHCFICVLL